MTGAAVNNSCRSLRLSYARIKMIGQNVRIIEKSLK